MIIRAGWGIIGLVLFASVGFAQYTMDLTGVGTGVVADGVYVSPYQGTITEGSTPIYSGYMICDDFTDEASLFDPWTATATNANDVTATGPGQDVLFSAGYDPFTSTAYSAQVAYDAVAWLAVQLVQPSNLSSPTIQTNISFAIWDIMDNATTNPDGGASTEIADAFAAVAGGWQPGIDGNPNVTVYTPDPIKRPGPQVSQEFLVVTTPEASTLLLLAVDLLGFIGLVGFLRKRASRSI